jgi:hypothetical protein
MTKNNYSGGMRNLFSWTKNIGALRELFISLSVMAEEENLLSVHIHLCGKAPVGIWKVNGYGRIVQDEVVVVADNASAAKDHQILITWKDGDIVLLNVLAAIANADLSCRMQTGSCSSLNLTFRVVPWAGIVGLSSTLISGGWIEGRSVLALN